MTEELARDVVEALTLRFTGENEDGSALHELRASHVAEVLEGLVGLTSDFDKAGVFSTTGPSSSEILVRPAQEGSFLIEVVRFATEAWEAGAGAATAAGVPTIGVIFWWATKYERAGVKDFTYLDNGSVKVIWQDDLAEEIPREAWEELNKRKHRRRKQLRQIMAPLSDTRVEELDVAVIPSVPEQQAPEPIATLTRDDLNAVQPLDDVEESSEFLDLEAQLAAVDFEDPTKWRVKAAGKTRSASVEDEEFLGRVSYGLAIRSTDIFRVRIREDVTTTNARSSTKWTILKVESYRRASHDDEPDERTA
jgi:hypothetical protein